MDLDRAVLELTGLKLLIEYRETRDNTAQKKIVYDQYPKAGTKAKPGEKVVIFYNAPEPRHTLGKHWAKRKLEPSVSKTVEGLAGKIR